MQEIEWHTSLSTWHPTQLITLSGWGGERTSGSYWKSLSEDENVFGAIINTDGGNRRIRNRYRLNLDSMLC